MSCDHFQGSLYRLIQEISDGFDVLNQLVFSQVPQWPGLRGAACSNFGLLSRSLTGSRKQKLRL